MRRAYCGYRIEGTSATAHHLFPRPRPPGKRYRCPRGGPVLSTEQYVPDTVTGCGSGSALVRSFGSCANVDDARECSMRRQCKLQSLHSNIRLETSCVLACVNTTAFVCHRAGTGARRHRQLRTRAYGAFSPPPPALKKAPPRATLQGGGRPCRASTSGRGHGAWRCSAGATPKARA